MSRLTLNSPPTNAPSSDLPQVENAKIADKQGQTEEMLRLYERAMAAASNGIVIVDAIQPKLPIIYCNSAFERITGYSQSEVVGQNCRILQGKDTDQTAIEQIRQAVRSGSECCVTLKNYRKDGTPFWNELVISPVLDANGKVTHFIGIQNDITKPKEAEESLQKANEELEKRVEERTAALQQANEKLKVEIAERQWAEAALRESEARFRAIFEKSAIGIAMADMKGQVIVSNQALQKMLGYSEAELLNMVFTEFTHPEDADTEIELYQQLIGGERDHYQMEKRYYRKDGELVWGNVIVSLIRDGNGKPLFAIGVVTNISDRQLAEDALRTTTSRLSAIIQNLQSGVLVENELRQIVLVNQDFCQKFGISAPPSALIGMDCSQSAQTAKYLFAETEKFVQRVEEILEQRKIVTNEELLLNDGRIFERDYVPIFVKETYYGHLWMYRDITDRNQAETELRVSLKEKEVLLKEIHHRVKNNLQVISSLLKLQSGYIDDPSTLALFTDSQNRVKAMALIHEKLYQSSDLSRIQVSEYIHKLTNNLFQSYSINASGIKLTVDVDDVFLDVDTAIPCGLIINELLSNCLKYAFPQKNQGEISIEFHFKKQEYYLKISDNGVGLPSDFNLEETESLGLQLVWNLTAQLGGNIKLDASNGTCFEITFAKTIH